MAERRMFAKTIIDSDAFLDMPITARLLYYDLSMRADDDGFINSPKKIQRMIGVSEDDLKLLIIKNFIIPFESGVVVIKHWKIHNYIQKDRYKPTVYQEEKALLWEKDNNVYSLDTECIQNGYNLDTQVRLGKDRLELEQGKDSIETDKAKKKERRSSLDVIIDNYTEDEKLRFELKEHLKTRKAKKGTLTDRAIELSLQKLDELAKTDELKIKIVQQSIRDGWTGFFPLKKDDSEKLMDTGETKAEFLARMEREMREEETI